MSSNAATAGQYAAFGFEQLEAPPRARRGTRKAAGEPAAPVITPEMLAAQVAQAHAAGLAEGHAVGVAEGLEAGRAEALAQLAPLFEALDAAGAELRAERDRSAEVIEPQAVELALSLAHRLVAGVVEVQPERIVDVVRGALRGLVERERVTVLVNPDDLALMTDAAQALGAELGGISHFDVQAERRVARGGALVRTDRCEIDATAQGKLDRAREALMAELAS